MRRVNDLLSLSLALSRSSVFDVTLSRFCFPLALYSPVSLTPLRFRSSLFCFPILVCIGERAAFFCSELK